MSKETSPVERWLETMRGLWLGKEPDRIGELLAPVFIYFESPFDPPLTTIDEVRRAWQTIEAQEIESVEIEVLFQTDRMGVAQWRFRQQGEPEHIGAYYLELDEQGLCTQFRQWWNVKA